MIGEIAKAVLWIVAWFAPIGFFMFAGVVRHRVAGGNEAAGRTITCLFIAVWALLMVLLYNWA